MSKLARKIVLGIALAVSGCAGGIVAPADLENTIKLMAGTAESTPQATETAEPTQTAQASAGTIRVTVEGPEENATPDVEQPSPFVDDPAPPVDEFAPAADEPAVTVEESAPTEDELMNNEPEAGAVVTDESDEAPAAAAPTKVVAPPAQPRVMQPPAAPVARPPAARPTIVQPPVARPPVTQPQLTQPPVQAPFVQPPAVDNTGPAFTYDQEEVVTPAPLPASPFKPGADEANLDRFSRQVTDVPVDIRPTEGELPTDLAADHYRGEPTIDETVPDDAPPDIFCSWTPWTVCYRPLYFEDIPLERYGCNVGCLQTGLSGVKFFGSIAALPYKMTVRPPRSCQCSNGFSRCGDCPLPGYGRRQFRLDAAAIEGAAIAGVAFILP